MSGKNVIVWSKESFLDWSDFKAESNPAVYEDSHSVIKYHCTWTVCSEKFGKDIVFFIESTNITTEFHPLLSWVRPYQNTDYLLKHEQGHFDLAELTQRENLKNFQVFFHGKQYSTRGQNEEQRKQYAKEDSAKLISAEIAKLEQVLSDRRQEYDISTNFGQNKEKQSKYNILFEKLRNSNY